MPVSDLPYIMTIAETCTYLRMSRAQLLRHRQAGHIETRLLGSKPMIPRSEIERIADEGLPEIGKEN